ncbi:magnesium chelatase subunit H [Rhodopseudomonas rhenobacensis]|nr:magnesium chelatase subunit H [Rhodopseudomonas rhenobacensis]
MPKRTSPADATPLRVVIVTMDSHLSGAAARARNLLRRDYPGIELTVHSADEWGTDEGALGRCHADIASGDIVIATMLFLDDHVRAVMPALLARRLDCDALICCMSAAEVVKLTRVGKFDMSAEALGAISWLKKLRGKKEPGAAGKGEMKMLRQLPKLLRFIPGTAQDMRAYFLTLQYWLAGSEQNIANMVRLLVDRYASGPRKGLRGVAKAEPPVEYADIGVYHPKMKGRIAESVDKLPPSVPNQQGTVGVLLLRSYLLAGNSGHYDGMIEAFEAKGLRVIAAFASGLDQRPAIEKFFMKDGRSAVDAVVSLTGFSLVGGPAYNDSKAAEDILATLDVPYLSAHPVEFQTLEQWAASDRGLMPVESTIMVAIPELDGCTGPMVYGGRSDAGEVPCAGCDRACKFTRSDNGGDMYTCSERAEVLAARTAKLVALRRSERKDRKVAVVLFNFPPNSGHIGTAAFLGVFESVYRTLEAMKREGYQVELPANSDELRERIIGGNSQRFGSDANVHARVLAGDHVKNERWLREIEGQWGPAPGKHQSDGSSIFVLGERFGNVFVGVQPAFGYEGDPMRLLFEKGFAPTHAFSAFYRWLKEDFGAHAVLHFGTHGALEFMPGKQTGLSGACWPDRMIGDLPNIYLYASNNPSEGSIAKRRSAATLISYLTPPVAHAGLYRGLVELKSSIERWRGLSPDEEAERADLAVLIQAQASALDLATAEPAWGDAAVATIAKLSDDVLEMEYALIPHGLHVVGENPTFEQRVEMLQAVADASHGIRPEQSVIEGLVRGERPEHVVVGSGPEADANIAIYKELAATDRLLAEDHEIPSLIHALDGKFIRPAPGGDLLRTPAILPTGRNLHGFDPFRIPSAFAVQDGAAQAQRLIEKHMEGGNGLPESVAIVLWGTDNLKNEGAPIGQALALLGARPKFDSYGRLTGAELIPLGELGRPRIDVIITMSGIFRDLLPLQIKLLAEACFLAASADEPTDFNFVRRHSLAYMEQHKCDMETASLRVFGNADGAYGSNVNHLVENSRWEDEDELAETYTRRKSFAYGMKGQPVQQADLLKSALADVDLAYQNLDSVELGVTTVDHYFDTLGGISRAVRRAKGGTAAPVYIGDQTRGAGTVRTLSEQVALETRTRMLNPKWYEGMLKHGYEGVRQIEEHVTNTMGWSATTGEVAPWVYRQLTETFVLDPEMRARLAALNPVASAKVANRLIEAHERNYWSPDPEMLEVLRKAGEELEDRLEGVGVAA